MIVVDANVVSEIVKRRPSQSVVEWLKRFTPIIAIPTVVVAELYMGVELTEDRERKNLLIQSYDRYLGNLTDHIIVFDFAAAMEYASLTAHRQRIGKKIKVIDAQIAATARAHRASVATRNVKDFEETGVDIVNPWDE